MLGGLLGGIASGVLGLFGAKAQNSANQEMSRESMEWQERMRDTQYQSAVKDLNAAGLSPMVAYGNGANQTPSAPNTPRMENEGAAAASSAMAAMQMQNMKAQNELIEAQAEKTKAETELTTTSTGNIAQQTTNLVKTLENIS